MVNLALIQVGSYRTNQDGIKKVSKFLIELGKKNTDIVCLPEQWLKDNYISDEIIEFSPFAKIAKEYSMTIISGAFYKKTKRGLVISSAIIGPNGDYLGSQEKIHPFDYERGLVKSGKETKIFKTSCRFGVVICYDMVFPQVVNSLVKKGAEVVFSPSRIVKRGIIPWHMYVQVRALENRVPILAANVENHKFGGNSIIVDLKERDKVVLPKIVKLHGNGKSMKKFDLTRYEKIRDIRFSDSKKFR